MFRGRYNFFWRIVVVLSILRGGIGAWSEGKLVAKKHPYPFLASFEKSRFSQFSPLTQGRHASALIGFRLNLQLLWIQCCVSKQKANSILEQPLFLRSNVLVELSFFQQCLVTWKEQMDSERKSSLFLRISMPTETLPQDFTAIKLQKVNIDRHINHCFRPYNWGGRVGTV